MIKALNGLAHLHFRQIVEELLQEAILSERKEKSTMARENLRPLEVIAQALQLISLCLREIQAAEDLHAAELHATKDVVGNA